MGQHVTGGLGGDERCRLGRGLCLFHGMGGWRLWQGGGRAPPSSLMVTEAPREGTVWEKEQGDVSEL